MKKLNRIKSRTSRRQKNWCPRCDANHIADYETCSVCGTKMIFKKKKINGFNKGIYD